MNFNTIQLDTPKIIATNQMKLYKQIGWYIVSCANRREFIERFPDANFEVVEEIDYESEESVFHDVKRRDDALEDITLTRQFPIVEEIGILWFRKTDIAVVCKNCLYFTDDDLSDAYYAQQLFFSNFSNIYFRHSMAAIFVEQLQSRGVKSQITKLSMSLSILKGDTPETDVLTDGFYLLRNSTVFFPGECFPKFTTFEESKNGFAKFVIAWEKFTNLRMNIGVFYEHGKETSKEYIEDFRKDIKSIIEKGWFCA